MIGVSVDVGAEREEDAYGEESVSGVVGAELGFNSRVRTAGYRDWDSGCWGGGEVFGQVRGLRIGRPGLVLCVGMGLGVTG